MRMGWLARITLLGVAISAAPGCGPRDRGDAPPDKSSEASPRPETAPADTEAPPTLELAKDGYPTGQSTPEGVACDLARAFLVCDSALFKRSVATHTSDGLEDFVKEMVSQIDAAKDMPIERRGGPTSFKACYAARSMTKDGPASFPFAVLRYDDLKFVDVVMVMHGEPDFTCRTLVLLDEDGKWYAHPDPARSPLLMGDLNQESKSTVTFQEAYKISE